MRLLPPGGTPEGARARWPEPSPCPQQASGHCSAHGLWGCHPLAALCAWGSGLQALLLSTLTGAAGQGSKPKGPGGHGGSPEL